MKKGRFYLNSHRHIHKPLRLSRFVVLIQLVNIGPIQQRVKFIRQGAQLVLALLDDVHVFVRILEEEDEIKMLTEKNVVGGGSS